ncbi:hypothetical protein AB0L34_24390 [Micromonospora sp. NPDC052213]|uniref:hypothetical protein n=1 Tax=Micromonospora sp. NPDC052213 TaxID=3155812 RepID=UPI003417C1E5
MPERFADLSTPLIADACVRLGVPRRAAPAGIRAVVPGHRLAGRVATTAASTCSWRRTRARPPETCW